MRYSLKAMWAQRKPRRRTVTFREVLLPSTLASDLYASAYADVVRAWAQGSTAIMAEYERTLAGMTLDSAADISNVLVSVEADVSRLMVAIRLRLERWASRVEQAQRRKWVTVVKQATGLDISMMMGPADARETLGTVIERNVELVKSVSDQARARISDSVFRGLAQRKPAREVAAEIRESVAMGRARSLRIASHQLTTLAESLNSERRREAGINTWRWVHSGKLHPREDHVKRDGHDYDDDAKSGENKPPIDLPGQLPGCGCTSRAILEIGSEF